MKLHGGVPDGDRIRGRCVKNSYRCFGIGGSVAVRDTRLDALSQEQKGWVKHPYVKSEAKQQGPECGIVQGFFVAQDFQRFMAS